MDIFPQDQRSNIPLIYQELRLPLTRAAHKLSRKSTETFHEHMHDFFEVYYLLRGEVRFCCAGQEYAPAPHTAFLIPPGVSHGVHILTDADYERYTLHFDEKILNVDTRALLTALREENSFYENMNHSGVAELMQLICECIQQPDETQRSLTPFFISALLAALTLRCRQPASLTQLPTQPLPQIQRELLHYVNEHFHETIRLDDLASIFFLNRSAVNRIFRSAAGMTVKDYVTRKRVLLAQELLRSGVSALQAATQVGYGDYTSFYRAYMRILRHPPETDKLRGGIDMVRTKALRSDAIIVLPDKDTTAMDFDDPSKRGEEASLWADENSKGT